MTNKTNNFTELYAALNSKQKEAVDHIEGPMMVLAGPGTGKTQIIAMRIARILLETQMDPQNILCLTFTESGVVAMRKRLLEIIGTSAYYVRIHTFHSFCNDVIKENPEKFLFTRELEPLTDVERIIFFREILDGFPLKSPLKPYGDPYFYRYDIEKSIQDLKRENISPEKFELSLSEIENFLTNFASQIESFIEIHGRTLKEEDIINIANLLPASPFTSAFEEFFNSDFQSEPERKKARTALKNQVKKIYQSLTTSLPKQKELAQIYRAYQEKLRLSGRYDFEDMIIFVVNKFNEDPNFLLSYQEQFQYILVDEYQDTNGAQNEAIRLLGSYFENPNIFAVGDDKQSIYRFQGASLENILFFSDLYKTDIQIVSLKENYRSTQTILDAADSIIKNNALGIHTVFPDLSENLNAALQKQENQIQIAEFSSTQTENYFLVKKIQSLIDNGTQASEIAVLYRNHRDAQDLIDLFLRLNVPFRLEAGENILEDRYIQKLLNIFFYLEDQTNEEQLFYILNYDFFGIDPLEVAKLSIQAAKSKKSFFDSIHDENFPSAKIKINMENFANWKKIEVNQTFSEFFEHVIRESGYLDFILNLPEKMEHLNRLNTLFDLVKTLNRSNHALHLKDFIEYIKIHKENNLSIKSEELQTKKDAVRLMTAHKSKGLEFEYVFIIKCTDKNWGNKPSMERIKLPFNLLTKTTTQDKKERNEDERRLFYVALTRAKKCAYLTYANKNENQRDQVPSLFLQEINPELTEKIDTKQIEDEAEQRFLTVFAPKPTKELQEAEKLFATSLLENYKMSVTHLNNYLRCPRYFYYKNLLRTPSAKNFYTSFGSAIHEALRSFSIEYKNPQKPTKDYLLQSFEKYLKREVLSKQDYRVGLELGQKTLSDYYDTYQQEFTSNVLPEYDFSTHGVNLDGIPLTGKLDKIEILDEQSKTVHVVDYKTGNPDSKSKELAEGGEYRRQIAFYKLLCDLSPVFPYKMVSGEIDFVQKSNRQDAFKKQKYTITQEELSELKETITSVYSDIKNLKFLSKDEWNFCGECVYCKEL